MMKSTAEQKTRQIGLRFFSNASIYAIGSAVLKLGSLLVIPLYWRVLTPEDFGLISISQIIIQFLASVLDLGISGSIQRHFFEWQEKDRPYHLSALWSFSLIFSFCVCLALTVAVIPIASMFETDKAQDLILFGIWIAFFQNFGILPFALTRIKEQLPLFSLLTIGQFIVQTLCILIFIFPLKMGYIGFLYATLIGSIVYGIFSLVYIFSQIKFPFNWNHLKEPLAYALPTAPAGILEGLGFVLDRFVLQKFIGLNELGIYSLGRQFGSAYNFFVSMLKNSWVPLVYRMASERTDASKVISRLSTYYFYILALSALAVSLLAPDVVIWIGKSEYYGVSPYIPPFVFYYLLYGIGNIYGRGLDLAKKTQYYWIVYAVSFIVNLLSLWLLAPNYGAWGAIAALILAGLCRESTLIGLAHYFYPRKNDWISIVKVAIPSLLAFLTFNTLQFESLWMSVTVKTLGVFLTSLLAAYLIFGRQGFEIATTYLKRKLRI